MQFYILESKLIFCTSNITNQSNKNPQGKGFCVYASTLGKEEGKCEFCYCTIGSLSDMIQWYIYMIQSIIKNFCDYHIIKNFVKSHFVEPMS